ncbi:MAG: hypothetical protein HY860_02800 [Chlamydiales bacterium]|nr:hypothetical protein [Chlamydiales bacterium]
MIGTSPCIVFVHIGDKLPPHLFIAIEQARLFNDCDIVLIANQLSLDSKNNTLLKNLNVITVAAESLEKQPQHEQFIASSTLNRKLKEGFWFYATERFFYFNDFLCEFNIQDAIHLESDVMIYIDIKELLPTLKTYPGIAAVFDSDIRCIPSFVYIRHPDALSSLTQFMADIASKGINDMFSIGMYRSMSSKEQIGTLPLVHDIYIKQEIISSKDKRIFCNNVTLFNSIFDAAAIGEYLGGWDLSTSLNGPGFINPQCVVDFSKFQITWELDEYNRLIPYATYQNKKLRINNLHIHSKKLHQFASNKT